MVFSKLLIASKLIASALTITVSWLVTSVDWLQHLNPSALLNINWSGNFLVFIDALRLVDRELHQGPEERAACRAFVVPPLRGQRVPSAAARRRLPADARAPNNGRPCRPRHHLRRVRPCPARDSTDGYAASAVAQGRCLRLVISSSRSRPPAKHVPAGQHLLRRSSQARRHVAAAFNLTTRASPPGSPVLAAWPPAAAGLCSPCDPRSRALAGTPLTTTTPVVNDPG